MGVVRVYRIKGVEFRGIGCRGWIGCRIQGAPPPSKCNISP